MSKEKPKVLGPCNISQDTFAREIVKGTQPKQAMFIAYPRTKNNTEASQRTRLYELMKHPKIVARVEELYQAQIAAIEAKDLYNFEKGVRALTDLIDQAQEKIAGTVVSEAMSRVIISAIQELNKMFGYNDPNKKGNADKVNITFVNGTVNNIANISKKEE